MELGWGNETTKLMSHNVGLITSNGPFGNNIMTCEWIMRTSFNPAIVAVSIAKPRATYANIIKTKEFGISFAAYDQNILASVSGNNSAKIVDKIKILKELGFKFYKAKKIDALMVEGAAVQMECKIIKKIPAGDHVVFLAEVLDANSTGKTPLLYHAGKFYTVGEIIQKPSPEGLEKIREIIMKHKKSSA